MVIAIPTGWPGIIIGETMGVFLWGDLDPDQ